MSNNYRIPEKVELRIRSERIRDNNSCVYCRKAMIDPYVRSKQGDSVTIEHLRETPPRNNSFDWFKGGWKAEDITICCGSCNSSRGKKKLLYWFEGTYCTDTGRKVRGRKINENTVAKPVKEYIERNER